MYTNATSWQSGKIAIVHDWLIGIGGAERVVQALHRLFPQAPLYVLFHRPEFTRAFLPEAEIRASRWQRTYERLGGYQWLTPFLPLAAESLDLSEFDLVISTAQFSKGLILKPKTLHLNYCASPTRQLWDWQAEYRRESRAPRFWLAVFQHLLRLWDRSAATRVDHYIANSENTRRRIQKYYGRDATVIYPPVEPATSYQPPVVSHYFLIVSRLFKHKNIDIAIKAFNKLGWPLTVIGDGPEKKRLQKLAKRSAAIVFLGYQPDAIVQQYYAGCTAFLLPQEEDFGITPLEAMAHGKPVVALARGGALEYVVPGANGELFEDPCEEMLADGARRLKDNLFNYDPEEIKRTAERFNTKRFQREISELIDSYYFPQGSVDQVHNQTFHAESRPILQVTS